MVKNLNEKLEEEQVKKKYLFLEVEGKKGEERESESYKKPYYQRTATVNFLEMLKKKKEYLIDILTNRISE